jgi:hypothetical protein
VERRALRTPVAIICISKLGPMPVHHAVFVSRVIGGPACTPFILIPRQRPVEELVRWENAEDLAPHGAGLLRREGALQSRSPLQGFAGSIAGRDTIQARILGLAGICSPTSLAEVRSRAFRVQTMKETHPAPRSGQCRRRSSRGSYQARRQGYLRIHTMRVMSADDLRARGALAGNVVYQSDARESSHRCQATPGILQSAPWAQ